MGQTYRIDRLRIITYKGGKKEGDEISAMSLYGEKPGSKLQCTIAVV